MSSFNLRYFYPTNSIQLTIKHNYIIKMTREAQLKPQRKKEHFLKFKSSRNLIHSWSNKSFDFNTAFSFPRSKSQRWFGLQHSRKFKYLSSTFPWKRNSTDCSIISLKWVLFSFWQKKCPIVNSGFTEQLWCSLNDHRVCFTTAALS